MNLHHGPTERRRRSTTVSIGIGEKQNYQVFGKTNEVKSRKIFVSTGHLAALAPEAVQGL